MLEPLIRPVRLEDAPDLWEVRTQPGVIWGTLQLPTLPRERVQAQCQPQADIHSLVAEVEGKKALGFAPEGTLRSDAFRDGVYVDSLAMARLRGRAAAASRTALPPEHASAQRPIPVPHSLPEGLTVRPVRAEDAEALHRLCRQEGVVAHLDQTPSLHLETVRKAVTGLTWSQPYLVAEADGCVVGATSLATAGAVRRSHAGRLQSIAVDQAWHGRGVGTALLSSIIDLADRWLNLLRLEAQVPADDAPALALLRRFGFEMEAVQRAAFCRGGELVDLCRLGRLRRVAP